MLRGLVYSVLSAIAFGMMAIIVKFGYAAGMTHMQMLQSRFVFGLGMLLAVLAVTAPKRLKAGWRTILKAALIGLIVYTTQSQCFFQALETIPASTTALIFYLHPAIVTLLSALVFRMRITRTMFWSLLLVTGGCALVFYDAFLKSLDTTGVLYALGATLTFSLYLIICQKALKDEHPLTFSFYVVLFTAIGFLIKGGGPGFLLHMDGERFMVALLLGLVPTCIAVTLLYKAIELVGSAFAAIFSTVEPVATLLAAFWLLGEHIVWLQLLGTLGIVAGIVLPNAGMLRLRRRVADGD